MLIAAVLLIFGGCQRNNQAVEEYRYIIGVSMPNVMEPWLNNMLEEISSSLQAEDNDTNVIFKDAASNSQKQLQDIDQLLDSGIDLLIVTPQDTAVLAPKLEEVYQQIPVVVAGIRPGTDSYTAFIKFDDYQIGRMAGEYILEHEYQPGEKLVVVKGREDSPISTGRLEGFQAVIEDVIPAADVSFLSGEWLRDTAEDRVKDYLVLHGSLDIVFALNDEMAYGACIAAQKLRVANVSFVGVDGLDGENGGKELLKQGILSATVGCPGIGSRALAAAKDILNGRTVEKNIVLEKELLTSSDSA